MLKQAETETTGTCLDPALTGGSGSFERELCTVTLQTLLSPESNCLNVHYVLSVWLESSQLHLRQRLWSMEKNTGPDMIVK